MFLAIDIGNSHTVIGVFDNDRVTAEWRIPTAEIKSAEEAARSIRSSLERQSIDSRSITSAGIASVVPASTLHFETATKNLLHIQPLIVSTSLDLGIRVLYKDPMAVGADRLCNAVAGFAKYGGPLIIVDYGTATTYDVVALNGDYLGGVIAAGVESTAIALHSRTAKLPLIELQLPASLIGKETVESMQSGILYGAIDATEGMVKRLKVAIEAQEGKKPRVIGTGGFSTFIAKHSQVLEHLEPHLVLEGIRLICLRGGNLRT